MSLGLADRQQDLLDDVSWFCEEVLPTNSVYSVLQPRARSVVPRRDVCGSVQSEATAFGTALGGGHRDGATAPGRALRPRGGGTLQL